MNRFHQIALLLVCVFLLISSAYGLPLIDHDSRSYSFGKISAKGTAFSWLTVSVTLKSTSDHTSLIPKQAQLTMLHNGLVYSTFMVKQGGSQTIPWTVAPPANLLSFDIFVVYEFEPLSMHASHVRNPGSSAQHTIMFESEKHFIEYSDVTTLISSPFLETPSYYDAFDYIFPFNMVEFRIQDSIPEPSQQYDLQWKNLESPTQLRRHIRDIKPSLTVTKQRFEVLLHNLDVTTLKDGQSHGIDLIFDGPITLQSYSGEDYPETISCKVNHNPTVLPKIDNSDSSKSIAGDTHIYRVGISDQWITSTLSIECDIIIELVHDKTNFDQFVLGVAFHTEETRKKGQLASQLMVFVPITERIRPDKSTRLPYKFHQLTTQVSDVILPFSETIGDTRQSFHLTSHLTVKKTKLARDHHDASHAHDDICSYNGDEASMPSADVLPCTLHILVCPQSLVLSPQLSALVTSSTSPKPNDPDGKSVYQEVLYKSHTVAIDPRTGCFTLQVPHGRRWLMSRDISISLSGSVLQTHATDHTSPSVFISALYQPPQPSSSIQHPEYGHAQETTKYLVAASSRVLVFQSDPLSPEGVSMSPVRYIPVQHHAETSAHPYQYGLRNYIVPLESFEVRHLNAEFRHMYLFSVGPHQIHTQHPDISCVVTSNKSDNDDGDDDGDKDKIKQHSQFHLRRSHRVSSFEVTIIPTPVTHYRPGVTALQFIFDWDETPPQDANLLFTCKNLFITAPGFYSFTRHGALQITGVMPMGFRELTYRVEYAIEDAAFAPNPDDKRRNADDDDEQDKSTKYTQVTLPLFIVIISSLILLVLGIIISTLVHRYVLRKPDDSEDVYYTVQSA